MVSRCNSVCFDVDYSGGPHSGMKLQVFANQGDFSDQGGDGPAEGEGSDEREGKLYDRGEGDREEVMRSIRQAIPGLRQRTRRQAMAAERSMPMASPTGPHIFSDV